MIERAMDLSLDEAGREVGLPDDAHVSVSEYTEQRSPFLVEKVGMFVSELPREPAPIMCEIMGPFLIHIWRVRVFAKGSNAFIEALWHPVKGYSEAIRLEYVALEDKEEQGKLMLKALPILVYFRPGNTKREQLLNLSIELKGWVAIVPKMYRM